MADVPKERRREWTATDRVRIASYEREWMGPLRPEDIREQYHDERSVTVRGNRPTPAKIGPRSAPPKRKTAG